MTCSGRGSCNATTGVCECDRLYSGEFCQNKGMHDCCANSSSLLYYVCCIDNSVIDCPCFIINIFFLQMSVWMIVTAITKAPALTSKLPHSHVGSAFVIQAGLVKVAAKVS